MISLSINGKTHNVDVDPNTPLLWAIREQVGLTGTKYGCGVAQCGACTVHIDGSPIRSCSIPAGAAAGRKITTIEGLASGNTLFDAAALGVPAIALSTRERQRVTARHFAAIGSAIDAGDMDKAIGTRIAAAVGALAFDVARRRIMSEAGRRAVDGHGMNRTIDDIRTLYH